MTLGVNINTLLSELFQKTDALSSTATLVPDLSVQILAEIEKSLVQIVCGEHSGTGVLVNKKKGIFISNSHVVVRLFIAHDL